MTSPPRVRDPWWRRAAPYVLAGTWAVLAMLFVGIVGVLEYRGGTGLAASETASRTLIAMALVDVLLGPVSFTLLFFRRRRPRTVTFVITLLASFGSSSSLGAMLVALVSYAGRPVRTERRTRRYVEFGLLALTAAAGAAVVGVVTEMTTREASTVGGVGDISSGAIEHPLAIVLPGVVFALLAVGFCLAVGSYLGARRALLAELEDRAVRAESLVEASTERARTAERNRIAREMHDVLAHRISLVALHSGALSHRTDLPPEAVREAAGVITSNAQLALSELRQVLGVLRADNGDGGHLEPPQPTLDTLDGLLSDARSVGTRVRLSVIGIGSVPGETSVALVAGSGVDDVLSTLSPTVSRTAYRVLQEALTNARKHAPDAVVDVELSGRLGKVLTLAVTNPMPFHARDGRATGGTHERADGTSLGGLIGSGTGLTGLAERTDLAGGTLDHGIEPDGSGRTIFAVRAWLPWDENVGGWRGRGAG